jgi:hypothetical protein
MTPNKRLNVPLPKGPALAEQAISIMPEAASKSPVRTVTRDPANMGSEKAAAASNRSALPEMIRYLETCVTGTVPMSFMIFP